LLLLLLEISQSCEMFAYNNYYIVDTHNYAYVMGHG